MIKRAGRAHRRLTVAGVKQSMQAVYDPELVPQLRQRFHFQSLFDWRNQKIQSNISVDGNNHAYTVQIAR